MNGNRTQRWHRGGWAPTPFAAVAAVILLAACAGCANPPSVATAAGSPIPVPITAGPRAEPTTSNPASAGPAPARRPADVLDLSNWYLTLPTGAEGDPDTVYPPELATYSGPWFRLNDSADGVVFTAAVGGATTKNSTYPRTELRELIEGDKASWSNTSGTHTMRVRQAVLALPAFKPHVVTAQIHDGDDDVMEIRLEGQRLLAQYDDGAGEITIDPAYRLGTVFDLTIIAADGRVLVYYNGARAAEIDRSGSGWYFKSGSYVQSNPDKGDAPDAVGTVVIHALQVSHTS